MKTAGEKPGRGGGDYGAGLKPGERRLGAYAASAVPSRGRRVQEAECPSRSPFQRDRDRVLHATAFRRLIHKTQVFIFHEGDHYRTRLTHSLEVAQIARTIARQLRLDEDLAEVLALAHDLGHPPFGHAGERALDKAMAAWGGFDHNAQSLRAVASLERKYLDFDGLNLTWESLEGLAKHNGPVCGGAVGKVVARLEHDWMALDANSWGSAEAQVAALSDDIAYVSHDVDDGLRAALLTLDDLKQAPLTGPIARDVRGGDAPRLIYEVTRRMITYLVSDIVAESRRSLAALAPASPQDIRGAGRPLVAFSAPVVDEIRQLKAFLTERVYHSQRVMAVMTGAETIVGDLFGHYLGEAGSMPEDWRLAAADARDARRRARVIADFVAGMTDRYAIAEHRRLFDVTPELR
jgi:dGTPase